jgi:hypothetical protein
LATATTRGKHLPKLSWASRYGKLTDKHPNALYAGLFTEYPKATIDRASRMGYHYALETLGWNYRPFEYALYILP